MAPPGAGKSTGLPLAILDNDLASQGQIWMLEPRRLAAEQVANRLAHSLGETLGQSIGLITGERSKTSAKNKIIIMTEGVLTQKLIQENDIPQCAMVIFDEFHERNLSTDLGLALALQCQEYLREDLKLLIMSATLDVESLCEQLKAPLVKSEGRSYPVESIYRPVSQPQQNSALTRPLESSISQTIKHALQTHDGDILVFLPGIKEIQFVWDQLNALTGDCLILPLHGQLHGKDQNRVMTPSSQRKVILATDIAKTSLTLENVTVVIDSGLERIAQFNTKTGMDELITVTASQATSIQRAGRAGRVQAGCCYHMFSEEQFNVRPAFTRFAIELEDLAPFTLSLAQWGSLNLDDYFFLDRPDANRYESSQQLLRQLDILHNESLTPHGQSLGRLPLHPRLAHMIYGSKTMNLEVSACYMAAILAEGDPLYFEESNSDLNLRLELFSLQHLPIQFAHGKVKKALAKRIQDKAKRLIQLIAAPQDQAIDIHSAGPLTMLAYPDRIAQQRGKGYRLRSGQGCELFHNDHMKSSEFLAVAHLTRSTTQQSNSSTIRLAAQVTRDDIQKLFQSQYETVCSLDSSNKLHVIEQTKLGAIILNEQRKPASKEDQVNHTLQLVQKDGLRSLGVTEPELNLLAKLQLAHTLWPDIIPDFSEQKLQQEVEHWLSPFLDTATKLDLSQALLSRIDWNHQNQMKEWLPDQLELPSGRSVKIDYTESQPVVRCKLQECFGLSQSPVIAQGKVTIQLHLLSPAQRPLAQTTDLAFFWKEVYPDVRKENRGRYAKHPWPEDPLTAVASMKTKKRM
jgi:ATP-dependent helicase HrpB